MEGQGGVSEWSKETDSKSGKVWSLRGFESHRLRCPREYYAINILYLDFMLPLSPISSDIRRLIIFVSANI